MNELNFCFLWPIIHDVFYFKVLEISPMMLLIEIYFLEIGISYLTPKSISVLTPIQAKALHSGAFKLVIKTTANIILENMKF